LIYFVWKYYKKCKWSERTILGRLQIWVTVTFWKEKEEKKQCPYRHIYNETTSFSNLWNVIQRYNVFFKIPLILWGCKIPLKLQPEKQIHALTDTTTAVTWIGPRNEKEWRIVRESWEEWRAQASERDQWQREIQWLQEWWRRSGPMDVCWWERETIVGVWERECSLGLCLSHVSHVLEWKLIRCRIFVAKTVFSYQSSKNKDIKFKNKNINACVTLRARNYQQAVWKLEAEILRQWWLVKK